MVTANQEMSKVLCGSIQIVLKPIGFRKQALSFVRDCGEVLHVISIQKSDVSDASYIRTTLNIGIYLKRLALAMNATEYTSSESKCHIRRRIGFLMPRKSDVWWEVPDLIVAELVGLELADAIEKYALPYLNRLTTEASLVEEWRADASQSVSKLPELYLGFLARS